MSDAARDALQQNREAARSLVKTAGAARTRKMLEDVTADLVRRITQAEGLRGAGKGSFTAVQLRATLAQVRAVLKDARAGIKGIVLDGAGEASVKAGAGVIEYLRKADKAFRGAGAQPLALNEAAVLDSAREGARASVLRRLASSGEPVEQADQEPHPAKVGVLDRYGVETIGHFEDVLQRGLVGRKSWGEMRADIIEQSPFLQQAPASWAERIVRTEVIGSYNRAGWEGMREADEQLGDMVKILSATFDDRTSCLVASTRVSGSMVRAVFRRRYDGPATRLITKAGRDLTATPNHPMLTRRGWVAAGQLCLGDDLICDSRQKYSGATRDEHVTDHPPAIGEVFESLLAMGNRERRRGRQQDFYGDGSNCDIDILRPYSELRLGSFAALAEPTAKQVLAPTDDVHFCTGCGGLVSPRTSAGVVRFGSRAWCNPCIEQASGDESLGDPEALAYALERFAVHVRAGDIRDGHTLAIARMVLAIGEQSAMGFGVRSRLAARRDLLGDVSTMNVEGVRHLRQCHPSSVQLDRLVDIQRTSISGHVFDLSTSEGYFTAEGVYTGNSDSYAVHGQVRRTAEAFETWYGLMQHPPARPNDREIVVPHRVSWVLPKYLAPRTQSEIAARWRQERRKGAMPPIPNDSTVPRSSFGK